jgi:multidrug efflux pump subunit AcrA (membrane-fusion protein)
VDGVIELQRLQSILLVQSPAFGSEHGTISLFRITPASGVPQGGSGCVPGQATRVTVKLGVRSVQHVQIVDGLTAGDRVVLSDMSQYDGFTRVRIN